MRIQKYGLMCCVMCVPLCTHYVSEKESAFVLHLHVMNKCVCKCFCSCVRAQLSVYEYEGAVGRLADLSGDLPH